jgi:oligoribonuclease NrnB/cAMP/cGMP phosphodiesterase (DHH superfamily)
MSKTVVIYHSIDLDGWMSAAIVKHWFTTNVTNKMTEDNIWDSIDFIGYNHGQPIPDLSEYNKIIMCDISFPKDDMLKLRLGENGIGGKNLIWIDHHISSINDLQKDIDRGVYIEGIRNTKFAACELTLQYFFPNEPVPEIVRLLGAYDCFRSYGTTEEQKVLQFQYGARSVISNYEEAYNWLQHDINDTSNNLDNYLKSINSIYDRGAAIYKYLCIEAKQVYKTGFEIKFDNPKWDTIEHHPELQHKLKFICINKERFNPTDFGIDYSVDGYDGAACFHYTNGKWNFSLYSRTVDCSIIAKQYGGGGHQSASGMILTDEQFFKLTK